jgi:hypothetical protein
MTSYTDLRALCINCTLKRSPELSHTGGLVDVSRTILEKQGVVVDVIRAVDHDIATYAKSGPRAAPCGPDKAACGRT